MKGHCRACLSHLRPPRRWVNQLHPTASSTSSTSTSSELLRRYASISPEHRISWSEPPPTSPPSHRTPYVYRETEAPRPTPTAFRDPGPSDQPRHPSPAARYDMAADFVPSEADFDPSVASASSRESLDAVPLAQITSRRRSRIVDSQYEAMVKLLRERRAAAGQRTKVALPPLEADERPLFGQSRFDHGLRALSRLYREKPGTVGSKESNSMARTIPRERREARRSYPWFPGLEKRRVSGSASGRNVFQAEITRYVHHFKPLLEAEFAEEERIFNERMSEWSYKRSEKEGYALNGLYASTGRQPNRTRAGRVITFTRTKEWKDSFLPMNHFTNGIRIMLSRSDPLVNMALEDGTVGAPSPENKPVRGSVYSSTRSFIRVLLEGDVPDLFEGQWRLDVGHNDFALRAQLSAIEALERNVSEQDMSDFTDLGARQPLHTRRDTVGTLRGSDRAQPSDIDEKLEEQTVLSGTTTRNVLLRAFQQEYVPYDTSSSLALHASPGQQAHAMIPPTVELKPSDVDITPVSELLKDWTPTGLLAENQLIQSWAKRHRTQSATVPPEMEGDPNLQMNSSQMRAIAMMLSERLSLVQGPPGTGKTRVIIETIKLLKLHWEVPFPILVTAHTNVAVDNLLSGLQEHGVKAVRFGPTERVRPSLLDTTLERRLEAHPLYSEVEALVAEKDELFNRRDANGPYEQSDRVKFHVRKVEIMRLLAMKRSGMYQEVLANADVICTTCLSAASRTLKHIDFPMVFLDEASMATEPLSLLPLVKGSSHVAIIGDHKQLPPVIISPSAQIGGLATSLFERLIHERNVPSIMLDTQYRMHPEISAFPSQAFYNSDLRDGIVSSRGIVKVGLEPPVTSFLEDEQKQPTNVMFIDHDDPESAETQSIANHEEADLIRNAVADLLLHNPDLQGSDIGIIAPYAAQVRLIDSKLNSDDFMLNMEDVLIHQGLPKEECDKQVDELAARAAGIEIKTVDGFEGREKEVILFSTVRSNDAGYIGFLADWRRLNVGLTRAKRGLIVFGSSKTLESARTGELARDVLPQGGTEVWRDFMQNLKERGLIKRA